MPETPITKTRRAFRGTYYVLIDEAEAVENEEREAGKPVTLDELQGALFEILVLDLNTDEAGNPCGVQGLAVGFDTLEEMTPEEVDHRYGPQQPASGESS